MRYCFVLSDDVAMLKRRIEEVKKDFFSKSSHVCNTQVFWGDEFSPDFWSTFTAISFEASSDFIVLRKAEALKADEWKKLTEMIGILREDAFLAICIESAWPKNEPKIPTYISSQKCYTYAKNKKWYFLEPPLTADKMRSYIAKGVKERNISIEPNTLALLESMLSPPSSNIDNALDQLAFIAEDRQIEKEDLSHLSTSVPEIIIFDYIKHLESGKSYPLWQKIIAENKPEEILFPLIGILLKEAREFWKLSVGADVKLPAFIIEKKKNMAKKLGKAGIATLFSILSDADWSIKSGKKDIGQVLEELIFRLSLLYKVQN